jgi:hypothetical protein
MKTRQQADIRLKQEVDYRLSKWIITNIEQLLEPEEIEEIWRELLSIYAPTTASVENVCGTMCGDGLGKYVVPARTMNPRKAGGLDG